MKVWATNGILWRSMRSYRRAAAESLADLEPLRDGGPLHRDDIPLIVVVKNEARLLRSFLSHYRALGVTRFMVVDNASTDGTLDILRQADDVDLWRTTASYAQANQGGFWIDGLLWSRARDRWVVSVDADEFLVFAGMDGPGALQKLISRLQIRGDTRLLAPMLDVYSDRPIAETELDPLGSPLETLNWFDTDSEIFDIEERGVWAFGGPRRRLFFADEPERRPGLSKYPLLRYDAGTAFIGVHTPTPYRRNVIKSYGRLVHIKLHAGLARRAKEAIESRQYWQESLEYRRYSEVLAANPALKAHTPNSRRYLGPQSLIDAGRMEELKLTWRDHGRWLARRALFASARR